MIDLRSDTVTRPSEAMRRAMAEADVGDDVYGEDPTVTCLEETVAGLLGQEAGVYVPSGTMGNQIALRLLVPRGEELLCEAGAHVLNYEGGAAAAVGGISSRTLKAPRGLLDPDEVAAELRPAGYHTVVTRAVALEQTHNRGGGSVYPLRTLEALRSVTASAGVALHCDGARIWNASVASGVPLPAYGALFDTMSVCLSKALGAPVGSVLLGPAERMTEARVIRRQLGGAMRQAGVIAAAGLYAVTHNIERLAEDHARAQRLAAVCADAAPGVVDPADVETNIVPLDLAKHALDAAAVRDACLAEGVLVSIVGPQRVRMVLHLDVDDAGLDRASAVLRTVL